MVGPNGLIPSKLNTSTSYIKLIIFLRMQKSDKTALTLFDSLSLIMKTLKQSILLFQKLIIESSKQLPIAETIDDLNGRKAGLLQMSNLEMQNNAEQTVRYVFPRFICRLKEIVTMQQNQYLQSLTYAPIKQYLKDMEHIIAMLESDRDLTRMVKKFAMNIAKHSQLIPLKVQSQNKPLSTQPDSHLQLIGTNIITKKVSKPAQSKTNETSLMKALQAINKRFTMFTGMDLEFSHFRSTLFQARGKQQSLYENCYQRNRNIQCQIDYYSKSHAEYTRKKSILKMKKQERSLRNIKIEPLESKSGFSTKTPKIRTQLDSPTSPIFMIKTRNRRYGQNSIINPENKLIIDSALINPEQVQSLQRKREIQTKNKKNLLQMKNVVLTGNYFDQTCEQKIIINPKNSIYVNRKYSSYLSRILDSPQKALLKTLKHKNSVSFDSQNNRIVERVDN